MTTPLYGLDAELKARQDARYDPEREQEVVEWVAAVTGVEKLDELTAAEWLKDGQVLCALVNKVKPGHIKRVSTMAAPFKKMENITHFTDAAREFGVNESSMFATGDLYEEANMSSVIGCIYTFAGVIQSTVPEFSGPHLGVKINATVKDVRRAKAPATQTGGISGTVEQQSGFTGMRDHAPQAVDAHLVKADAQGLDADLKVKMAAKFDPALDAKVCAWIEEATGKAKGGASTADWLKDGQVICALANRIQPGSIPHVNASTLAFKQMENISNFVAFMRNLGMAESSLFSTPDLYEEKNMGVVIQSFYALGGVIQAKCPGYNGPQLGVAIHSEVIDKSRGLGLVTDQTEAMQRHMEVERPRDNEIVRGTDPMEQTQSEME